MSQTNEKPSKIRPRRIEFIKFIAADYHIYARPACPEDVAGRVLQDLIAAMLGNTQAEYLVNQEGLDEAREYINQKHIKIEEWKRKKYGNKNQQAVQPPAEPNLFDKKPIPKDWQDLPRHELEKIMIDEGITHESFHIWYEDSMNNDWRDKDGKPIRNPIAACRAYAKFPPRAAKESEQ